MADSRYVVKPDTKRSVEAAKAIAATHNQPIWQTLVCVALSLVWVLVFVILILSVFPSAQTTTTIYSPGEVLATFGLYLLGASVAITVPYRTVAFLAFRSCVKHGLIIAAKNDEARTFKQSADDARAKLLEVLDTFVFDNIAALNDPEQSGELEQFRTKLREVAACAEQALTVSKTR